MSYSGSDGLEIPVYRDDCAPEFKSLRGTFYFRLIDPGEILEVDAVVMSADEWRKRPESNDPTWRPLDYGSLVFAVKVLC